LTPELYYWRDSNGNEVDLLIDRGRDQLPLEAKAGATIAPDWFDASAKFIGWSEAPHGALVYAGTQRQRRGAVEVFGWRDIAAATQFLFDSQPGT
jgi:hypothetical protein